MGIDFMSLSSWWLEVTSDRALGAALVTIGFGIIYLIWKERRKDGNTQLGKN